MTSIIAKENTGEDQVIFGMTNCGGFVIVINKYNEI